MPGMAGGEKAKATPCGSFANSRLMWAMMASYFSSGFLPFLPRFERDEEEPAVGVGNSAQHAVTGYGRTDLDARRIHHDLFQLGQHARLRPLEGRCIRELHSCEHVSLVLFGKESARHPAAYDRRTHGEGHQHDNADGEFADRETASLDVAIGPLSKGPIEPSVEFAEGPPCRLAGLQEHGAEGRAQGQGIKSGDENRNSDGDGELRKQTARDPRDEDGRQKHRRKHQGNGDDRPRDLLHRFLGGLLGRQAVFDVVFHSLHHHDGIIDDKAYGQHQTHERNRVDGKTEQGKKRKSGDEGHGHGQSRDERRPEPLKKDEDDEDNQDHRLV